MQKRASALDLLLGCCGPAGSLPSAASPPSSSLSPSSAARRTPASALAQPHALHQGSAAEIRESQAARPPLLTPQQPQQQQQLRNIGRIVPIDDSSAASASASASGLPTAVEPAVVVDTRPASGRLNAGAAAAAATAAHSQTSQTSRAICSDRGPQHRSTATPSANAAVANLPQHQTANMVFPISQASSSGILRTKVVCTIGPASQSKETLTKLVKSGMNIARLNMSHCTHESAAEIISTLREVLQELPNSPPVGIWLDINGPKVRTGKLANGGPVYLRKGDEFFFVNDQSVLGDHTKVATTYTRELVQVGDKMCVDDGLLSFAVVERLENSIRCIVENNGVLGENKGINFPERTIEDLPTISPKDSQDIQFALKHDVDFISISCIRDIEDMTEVRIRLGNSQIKVLAKIENKRSMINFESILRVADGVVIDRGYLGAEVEVDVISIAQKKMVALANVAGKPIMIANQMLESMCTNPRPTRSEAADVANAVMDGVDGLVLSGETALGEYVVETVETMRKIANQAELNTNYLEFQAKAMRNVAKPVHVNESIASSAVLAARQIGATVIVCITEAGGTARLVAKYRPLIPVLAATTIARTSRQLMANFGLEPYHHKGSPETVVRDTLKYAAGLGICKPGDIAVVTSGQVIGFQEGTTTRMQIVTVPEF